jgi:hypothetical protein
MTPVAQAAGVCFCLGVALHEENAANQEDGGFLRFGETWLCSMFSR